MKKIGFYSRRGDLSSYMQAIAVFGMVVLLVCVCSYAGGREEVLAERTYYGVVFYAGRDANLATERAEWLRVRGGAGYLATQSGYRVYGCVYDDRTKAESVAKGVDGECKTMEIVCPKVVKRRVSAEARGVYLALAEDYSAFFQTLSECYRSAERGGNLTVVRARLSALAESWNAKAKGYAKKEGNLCADLYRFYHDTAKDVQKLTLEESSFSLSVSAKYVLVEGVFRYRNLRDGI